MYDTSSGEGEVVGSRMVFSIEISVLLGSLLMLPFGFWFEGSNNLLFGCGFLVGHSKGRLS